MATSGQTAFDLDLGQIAEEAFERCGAELTSGYDLRTARRSLNLLLLEWANRGVNLWTVRHGEIFLEPHRATYPLRFDVVDVIDTAYKATAGTDYMLRRIPVRTYSGIVNKSQSGRPSQYWVDRQTGGQSSARFELAVPVSDTDDELPLVGAGGLAPKGFIRMGGELIQYSRIEADTLKGCYRDSGVPHLGGTVAHQEFVSTINIWPVPDPALMPASLDYWYLRRMDDTGAGEIHTPDVPYRFLPALVAGLAFFLSSKIPGVPVDRIMLLKQEYEEQWALAATEDRDKSTLRIVPSMGWGR